jgi:hypothetical protein
MTTPTPATPATDFTNPPGTVSFEEFSTLVLADWVRPELEGDTVSCPRMAAAKAAYLATVVHAKQKGTVLVACSDSTLARACQQYVTAYFTDQPHLAKTVKRHTADGVELTGGRRILVTDDATRRPAKMLACIKLAESVVREQCSIRDMARCVVEIARKAQLDGDEKTIARMEQTLKVEPGFFAEMCASNERRRIEQDAAWEGERLERLAKLADQSAARTAAAQAVRMPMVDRVAETDFERIPPECRVNIMRGPWRR